jgi:hypothetical protein
MVGKKVKSNMEEIFSLPPIKDFFNNDYSLVLEFMDTLGNPKFKIAGDVDLYDSDIESFGNLVEVEGNLNLGYTNITSLPDNLKVGGYLFLEKTNITSLPHNLKVGSNLFLERTPLSEKYTSTEIREMIENKGGYVNDNIYI